MLRILTLYCTFLFSFSLYADTLSEANKAYDAGSYQEAVKNYEDLVRQGYTDNGPLYYNLGNAYFRSGEKGKAMAAYLAARSLIPRDPDLKANLKFVHEQTVDKLSISSTGSFVKDLSFWIDMGTAKEFIFIASFIMSICLCLLFISLLMNTPLIRVWSYIFGVLAFFAYLAAASSFYYRENWGAVSIGRSDIRSGPGELNTVVFQLHEGAPFILDAKEDSWYKIRLSDQKIGWVSAKDVTIFPHF